MSMHLHLDCFSGISGDMLLGALVDVGLSPSVLKTHLKKLSLDGYRLHIQKVHRGTIHATKVTVDIQKGYGTPLTLPQIRRLIQHSTLPMVVKGQAQKAFDRLAEAEGMVHGIDPRKVHFHEVGVIDSFVDVVGGILGCHLLGIDTISATPVNVGSGYITTHHGTLPVPAPAVAYLAKNIPIFSNGPSRELTTPTGLSVLTALTHQFGPLPFMVSSKVGYGAGTGNPTNWPNVLRVFLGNGTPPKAFQTDRVVQVETNIDDLNPQVYEVVMDHLFEVGALDVTLTPVIMKRSRPGTVISVLAPAELVEAVSQVLFQETSTLGVRMQDMTRYVLPRSTSTLHLKGGAIRIKCVPKGLNGLKYIPEYQDCRSVAEKTGRPIREVMEDVITHLRTHKRRPSHPPESSKNKS